MTNRNLLDTLLLMDQGQENLQVNTSPEKPKKFDPFDMPRHADAGLADIRDEANGDRIKLKKLYAQRLLLRREVDRRLEKEKLARDATAAAPVEIRNPSRLDRIKSFFNKTSSSQTDTIPPQQEAPTSS